MQERRTRERFKLRLPAKVEVETGGPGEHARVQTVETENICSGGAFFKTLTPLVKGTRVKIELMLTRLGAGTPERKGSLLRVNGEVLRSDRIGMAVRFDKRHTLLPHPA